MLRFLTVLSFAILGVLATDAQARMITDAAGRKVEIPDKIVRVLPAGPPASILVYVLAPDTLTGWVRAPSDEEKAYLQPSVRDLPAYGRLTGKGGTANMEAVLAAKPDIILDVGTVDATYASLADKVQAQTGIPYVLIDGSFAKSGETLRLVGELLGVEGRAKLLADYSDTVITTLNDKLGAIPTDKRPKVYYGRGPEGLETGLSGSINLEILEATGATNVAAAAGTGGLTQVSLEQILSWNPDTILAASGKFAKAVKSDPLWANIEAVKNKRVFVAPSLPFGWFDSPPGINRLIGIAWLEKLFYPQSFSDDLPAEVHAFYKLFYQVDLTDDQVVTLLKGALPGSQ
ncbi:MULTISPECIES: iron ABC transporter substrate-binding protein [unclassified Rhizobium]|uniref:iron ABC transporter substrate-binding protein n=1 Tax=unclassified Rhizobium TaxID=2613769 RepID=UPI001ADA3F91|nr:MULTISPECIES: iron ABC transporter substrate-binding protein [unclassified Rhizobium]MBO9101128.1 iron ABC transporter substrate-binding protein [Rhizobium sp. L58/93]MBO9168392.1 iron ABC transporter substrate-binding protein [Rhizobium sp. L245/93]QXZ88193.1 iron ABC transporter substrate-binding protein [Rhizobium sp. K1/93]QXZ94367.1 iron ABC transporter substrate-binding protein [Rhizobium sp. K15/93]QYA05739.1 iron ABC transporter substrate-binding protein [Rhizobium sp. B21/90]